MNKPMNAAPTAQTPGFIDGLAASFVEANKDYYFGNIADRDVLEQRLTAFADCIDSLWKVPVTGKITALSRLVACYVQHSTDGERERAETLNAITGYNGLCTVMETLAAYSDTLEVWADFLGVMIEKIDE